MIKYNATRLLLPKCQTSPYGKRYHIGKNAPSLQDIGDADVA